MASPNSRRRCILRIARFLNAAERIEEQAGEAYHYDSQFDGGEFSGPATDKWVARAQDAAAYRLGFMDAASARMAADLFRIRV